MRAEKKYLSWILGLTGAVVAVALLLVWVEHFGKTGPKPGSRVGVSPSLTPVSGKLGAKLSLKAQMKKVEQNQAFKVAVILDSPEQKTQAVDAIIVFDPVKLEAIQVQPGTIFPDYPQKEFDNTQGKVFLSALSQLGQKGGVDKGEIATIEFVALQPGQTQVNLEFAPGATTDSNVIAETGTQDILTTVENLEMTIE